jgi:hypothetical protein
VDTPPAALASGVNPQLAANPPVAAGHDMTAPITPTPTSMQPAAAAARDMPATTHPTYQHTPAAATEGGAASSSYQPAASDASSASALPPLNASQQFVIRDLREPADASNKEVGDACVSSAPAAAAAANTVSPPPHPAASYSPPPTPPSELHLASLSTPDNTSRDVQGPAPVSPLQTNSSSSNSFDNSSSSYVPPVIPTSVPCKLADPLSVESPRLLLTRLACVSSLSPVSSDRTFSSSAAHDVPHMKSTADGLPESLGEAGEKGALSAGSSRKKSDGKQVRVREDDCMSPLVLSSLMNCSCTDWFVFLLPWQGLSCVASCVMMCMTLHVRVDMTVLVCCCRTAGPAVMIP